MIRRSIVGRRASLVVAVGVTLAVAMGAQAAAQTTATIVVDPPTRSVQANGAEFVVTVMVDDVTTSDGLGGYTLVMTYDNDVLEALSVEDAGFLEATENPVLCPSSAIDNDDGKLAHFCLAAPVIPEPGPTTDEPVELVRVTFQPVGMGESIIDISETSILDPDGDGIEATTANGTVVVNGADAGAPATPASDAAASADDEDGGIGAGVIAGIGTGAAAAVVIIGGGAFLWLRRRGGL